MRKLIEKCNGKKRYIFTAIGSTGISLTLLLNFNSGITANDVRSKKNEEQITKLDQDVDKFAEKIPAIEANTENTGKNLDEFKTEQRTFNAQINTKLDRIIEMMIQ